MHRLQRRVLRQVRKAARANPLLALLIAAGVAAAGVSLVYALTFAPRPPVAPVPPPPPPGSCQFFCESPA
ncbi:hypothetical protein [Nocardia sp. NPDC127526]|uniref:hypothetical protein n=1 Tax=Nocardia sp. NPDC127526 TaxID=3345393 RepID=UPI0036409E24